MEVYQFRSSGKQTLGWEIGVGEIYWEVKSARDKGEIKNQGQHSAEKV